MTEKFGLLSLKKRICSPREKGDMKKHVFIVNAHQDALIGFAGLAFILVKKNEHELHIVDFTTGERGFRHRCVPMEQCTLMGTEEEFAACRMLGLKPLFLNEIYRGIQCVFRGWLRFLSCPVVRQACAFRRPATRYGMNAQRSRK